MASRFWVGGTGTWDASDTTHWSATSGGAGGASVPGSSDDVTFNSSSGGGTVTVNTTVNVASITCGAFTGTLDFSVNNNNVTLSSATAFNASGTGARTIKLGNGTWTISTTTGGATPWNISTTTNLTFDAGSSTIDFTGVGASASDRTFAGGGLTYGTVRFRGQSNGAATVISGANTFGTLIADGPNVITLPAGTQAIGTLTINGSASGPVLVRSNSEPTQRSISVASNAPSINYAAFRAVNCTGGATFVANNSFDLGANSGITINPPIPGNSAASSILRSPLSPPV